MHLLFNLSQGFFFSFLGKSTSFAFLETWNFAWSSLRNSSDSLRLGESICASSLRGFDLNFGLGFD